MLFRTTIILSVVAATAMASAALAASAAKDPTKLILRKADMPAGAQYEANPRDHGAFSRLDELTTGAASYLGATFSNTTGFLQISGVVCTTASAAKARKAFDVAKAELDELAKRLRSEAKKIALPTRYGDQQFARYDAAGNEGIQVLELLVRRNTVVWLININHERRPPISEAAFLSEAKKYALRQRRRVGSG